MKSTLSFLLIVLASYAVNLNAQEGETCADAIDISDLLIGDANTSSASGVFNNYTSTTDDTDPTSGWECFADGTLHRTMWFTLVGDGNTYVVGTVACDGVNDFIDLGDSQMAAYTGTCDNLEPVTCSEDLNTQGFLFGAVVGLETEIGVTYNIMVDTYNGVDGEYCMLVIRPPTCNEIALGDGMLDPTTMCQSDTLTVTIDGNTTPLTNASDGFIWIFSEDPIPADSDNPFQEDAVGAVDNTNFTITFDETQFPPGTYYATPLIFGGIVDPEEPIEGDNGCFILGDPIEFEILEEGDPILGEIDEIDNANQTVSLTVLGGTGELSYLWSDGSTDEELMFEESGNYTVTISDESECTEDLVLEVDVVVSGLEDQVVEQIRLYPNPASSVLNLHWADADVVFTEFTFSNVLGQNLKQGELNGAKELSIDVRNYPKGFYFVRLSTAENNFYEAKVSLR